MEQTLKAFGVEICSQLIDQRALLSTLFSKARSQTCLHPAMLPSPKTAGRQRSLVCLAGCVHGSDDIASKLIEAGMSLQFDLLQSMR